MLSIITPIYNGERFIESCIKVVIAQNCPDIEHIIVDGGSSDRTIEIVQQYAQKYPHICWISEPDKGQSDAMNKGIAIAKGEIIGILNADDYYEENTLNRIVEQFKTLPEPTFLVGNCYIRDGSGEIVRFNRPAKIRFWDLVQKPFLNPFPCNPSAYFYHRSLHQKVGLYNIDEHYAMDFDFILRTARSANIEYIDEFWGNFYEHEDTKTAKDKEVGRSRQRVIELVEFYQKYLPWWRKLQITIKEKSPFLNRLLSRWLAIPKKLKAKFSQP